MATSTEDYPQSAVAVYAVYFRVQVLNALQFELFCVINISVCIDKLALTITGN